MVQISVDVPKLTTKELTPSEIREFRRRLRVFLAQNADFPPALLIEDGLQAEAEERLGKSVEEISQDELLDFLREEAMPRSLDALRTKLEKINCPTSSAGGITTRTAAIREFTTQFTEWADLAPDVAAREAGADFAALFPPVEEKQAFLTDDGEPEVRDITRKATTKEINAARAKAFDYIATKVFMKHVKPRAFYRTLDLEKRLLNVKTLEDTITLTRALAREEDRRGHTLDEIAVPSSNTAPGKAPSGHAEKPKAPRRGLKPTLPHGPTRNCRHCGQLHWDSECPTQQREQPKPAPAPSLPEAPGKVYSRAPGVGTLRPIKTHPAQAAETAVQDETLSTKAIINGAEYVAIIDTGAGQSFISEHTLECLNKQEKRPEILTRSPYNILLASGEVVKDKRKVNVTIELPELTDHGIKFEQEMLVIPGSQKKLLLGCATLRSLGFLTKEQLHIRFNKEDAEGDSTTPYPHEYLCEAAETVEDHRAVQIPNSDISEELHAMVEAYADTFEATLPPEGSVLEEMEIRLKNDEFEIHQRPRPLNNTKRELVRQEVASLREQGYTEPARGPYSSPVVVVTGGHKGSSKIRLCVDYKQLNEATEKDHYPLPDIRTFVRAAAGCNYFAALDLRQGYYQVNMRADAIAKTAFITQDSYDQFKRLPFGLCNAPAHFQRAMDKAFASVLHKGVSVYLDDIFVYAKTAEEFKETMKKVLGICRTNRLRLKAQKSIMGAPEIEVVGFVCDKQGYHLSEQRIKGISDLQAPQTTKELERLLGSLNYVARFVPDASRILIPLQQLRKKDTPFSWGPVHDAALDQFKKAIREQLSLAFPDLSAPWALHTDASEDGYGGVLYQLRDDGQWEIISFFAGTFTDTQRRWSTYEQELYGILACLTRPDMAPLFRLHNNLQVRTDHRNLVYMHNRRDFNNKLLRWALILADYTFTIDHIPGRLNVVADHLSRLHCNTASTADGLRDQIRRAQTAAPDEERQGWEASPHFHLQPDGLWTHEDVPVIPEMSEDLKLEIIRIGHHRHDGRSKTLQAVSKIAWWPGRADMVATAVKRCPLCLKTRLKNYIKSPPGQTTKPEPWDTIAIDTMGPIKTDAHGMQFIYVVIDLSTRWTELIPAPLNNARQAATALWSVITRHGTPHYVKSDNGTEYTNRVICELLGIVGAHHQRTLPYHPQSNGVVERRNREIMRHVRWLTLAMDGYDRWSETLPYVQHILNTTTHSATGFTPQEALYGRNLGLGKIDLTLAPEEVSEPLAGTMSYLQRLEETQRAIKATEQAKAAGITMVPPRLEPGQWVLEKPVRKDKLHGLLGPFKVHRILDNKAVELTSLIDDSTHTSHESRLSLFDVDCTPTEARKMRASDDETWVVTAITSHDEDSHELLVSWEGYDKPTWEPYANLAHLDDTKAYMKKHKLSPRRWRE